MARTEGIVQYTLLEVAMPSFQQIKLLCVCVCVRNKVVTRVVSRLLLPCSFKTFAIMNLCALNICMQNFAYRLNYVNSLGFDSFLVAVKADASANQMSFDRL